MGIQAAGGKKLSGSSWERRTEKKERKKRLDPSQDVTRSADPFRAVSSFPLTAAEAACVPPLGTENQAEPTDHKVSGEAVDQAEWSCNAQLADDNARQENESTFNRKPHRADRAPQVPDAFRERPEQEDRTKQTNKKIFSTKFATRPKIRHCV